MKPTVTHSTFTIERSYPTTPERVFAAFADPQKKRRWYADANGRQAEIFEMDFRVGGSDRTQSRLGPDTPFPGIALTNHSTYQDIQPNRRIVLAYTMSLGDRRISASLATVEFLATDKGTDLIFTDQGAFFEGSDGPKMREQGWNHLLDGIAAEVIEASHAPA
jgi:uncharacterized protein YndB with AHSA1/START domain